MQLFIETRAHLDLDDLDDAHAAELGQLIVRVDRAVQAIGGIGRVHFSRCGDGGSHFHMWVYGWPVGSMQLYGFCLPMWAQILPPIDEAIWEHNLAIVARELARHGGQAQRPRS